MSTHYNIHTREAREIDPAIYAAWVLAANPKADVWQSLPAPPSHNPATQHPPEWIDGAWVVRDMTPEEIAAAARKVWPDTGAFLAEFTESEQEDIAMSADPVVGRLRLMLSAWRARLFSDDPRVAGGLQYLESISIITLQRHTAILTP